VADFADGEDILEDDLPASPTFGVITVTNVSGVTGSISCAIATGTLTCEANGAPVSIASGGSFTVSFLVAPASTGVLSNPVATVDPDNVVTEGNEGNNTASDSITIAPKPDLTVVKDNDDADDSIVLGESFTWTFTISNAAGTSTAYFADTQDILEDDLPAGPTYGAITVDNFSGVTGSTEISCAIAVGTLTCEANGGPVSIANGGSFTASFLVTPASSGVLSNPLVTVDPGFVVDENNEANNTASDSITIAPKPDLTVDKDNGDPDDTIVLGESFTWTFTISNAAGTSTAIFANGKDILEDDLPAGPTYGAISVSNFTGVTGSSEINCVIATGSLTCESDGGPVSIASGGSFVVSFQVDPASTGVLDNTNATVDPDNVIDEGNEGNNTASDSITVVPKPDLTIDKSNNASVPQYLGIDFTWTITVANDASGSSTASFEVGEEIIKDTLPAGATYEFGTLTPGATAPGGTGSISCAIVTSVLTCSASGGTVTLSPGASFSATVTVLPTVAGDLDNTVQVDPDGRIDENDETNNSDADAVTISVDVTSCSAPGATGFVTSFNPPNNSTGVSVGINPVIRFNQAMDASTLVNDKKGIALCAEAGCGGPLSMLVTLEITTTTYANDTVTIIPDDPLEVSEDYWINAGTDIENACRTIQSITVQAEFDTSTTTSLSCGDSGAIVSAGTIIDDSGNKEIEFDLEHSETLTCQITDMEITWPDGTNGDLKEILIDLTPPPAPSRDIQQIFDLGRSSSPGTVGSSDWKDDPDYRNLEQDLAKRLIFEFDNIPQSPGSGNYTWMIRFDDFTSIEVSD
jgi:hypothetical protein